MIKTAVCCMLAGSMLLSGGALVAKAGPSSEAFSVGEASITALQDMSGEFPVALFKGADEAALQKLVPSGKLASTVNVFLVHTGGKTILVDTGNGLNTAERRSALPDLLEQAGVKQEAVVAVLLTHMHGDHIGGLVREGKAFFPNAVILVSEPEKAFWTGEAQKGAQSAYAGNAALAAKVFVAYGDQARTFGFGETVLPGITAHAAQGHTPGHTMFALASQGKQLFFWGDLVHATALQFANPDICATYDMDMEKSRAARKEIMDKAASEGVPVAGAHLTYPGIGRVGKGADGGFVFLPGLE